MKIIKESKGLKQAYGKVQEYAYASAKVQAFEPTPSANVYDDRLGRRTGRWLASTNLQTRPSVSNDTSRSNFARWPFVGVFIGT